MSGLYTNFRLGWLGLLVFAVLLINAPLSLPTRAQSSTSDPALPRWWPGAEAIAQYPKCKPSLDRIKTSWRSTEEYRNSAGEHCQVTMFAGISEFTKPQGSDYDTSIRISSEPPFEREAQSWKNNYNHLHITMYIYTKNRQGTDANIGALGPGFENFDKIASRNSGWRARPLVENATGLCPAGLAISKDIARFVDPGQVTDGGFVYKCQILNSRASTSGYTLLDVYIEMAFPRKLMPEAPAKAGACTTDLLKGPWRAENAALAKTGHAVTFTAAPNMPKHDDGQIAYRGIFSTYPKHKNLLGLVPTPMFSSTRGYVVGKDQCLIPVVINMRDSGVSRSAVLVDARTGALRFVTEQAYRWTGKGLELTTADFGSFATSGAPGRWLRGAVVAEAPSCTPADFNGRWDRTDGARITIRGAGTQGVGGTASMDEHPDNWVQGQNKYVSMRMKEPCVYTAKCFASQRTLVNNRPDFKMVETACELVIDPVTKKLRERGTANSYSYTKVGAAAAATSKPPPPVAIDRAAEAEQSAAAVQSLNTAQAEAAKREAAAFAAQQKAAADKKAAQDAAYRQSLADHQARTAAYNAQVAAHAAKVAELNRKAAEDQAKWQAAVAACKAGDRSQCAPK